MADNTSNYGLPYPEPSDGVVVHADIERLARRVDTVVPTAVQSARNEAIQDATQKYGDLPQRVSDTETGLTQMIPKAEADQYITPGPPGPGGSIALEETDPGCFADSEITWVQWNAAGTEASVWNPIHNRYELLHTADHIRVDTSVGTRVFVGDTMIYGDTGWRDMRDVIELSAEVALFRRTNNEVTWILSGVDIPSTNTRLFNGITGTAPMTSGGTRTQKDTAGIRVGSSGSLFAYPNSPIEQTVLVTNISYPATTTWLNSTPGTPA